MLPMPWSGGAQHGCCTIDWCYEVMVVGSKSWFLWRECIQSRFQDYLLVLSYETFLAPLTALAWKKWLKWREDTRNLQLLSGCLKRLLDQWCSRTNHNRICFWSRLSRWLPHRWVMLLEVQVVSFQRSTCMVKILSEMSSKLSSQSAKDEGEMLYWYCKEDQTGYITLFSIHWSICSFALVYSGVASRWKHTELACLRCLL